VGTALLIYYGGCVLGLWGISKVAENCSGNSGSSSGGGGNYGEDIGPDGETLGMPYMP